jgi:hypothetical protein
VVRRESHPGGTHDERHEKGEPDLHRDPLEANLTPHPDSRSFDASLDGQRFVMIKRTAATEAPRLIVV